MANPAGEIDGRGVEARFRTARQPSALRTLKRPIRRLAHRVRRYHASFSYQAQSWNKPRPVVAKVEWHPSELYPRVGFIVTNLAGPTERAVAVYNQRRTGSRASKKAKARSR